jgi:hypothetical protein
MSDNNVENLGYPPVKKLNENVQQAKELAPENRNFTMI